MVKKIGKRTLKATPTYEIEGKLQPQAVELERAVLGALMIDSESLSDAIDSLKTEYFYLPKHQKIFEAIVNLFNNTQPVDILTVSEELKRIEAFKSIGGLAYISELTNNVASASNTEGHPVSANLSRSLAGAKLSTVNANTTILASSPIFDLY